MWFNGWQIIHFTVLCSGSKQPLEEPLISTYWTKCLPFCRQNLQIMVFRFKIMFLNIHLAGNQDWFRWQRGVQGGFSYEPSQWETSLHCTDISHWLGAYLDWSLVSKMYRAITWTNYNPVHWCIYASLGPDNLKGNSMWLWSGTFFKSFPSLPYINSDKIVLRSDKFQILFWRL